MSLISVREPLREIDVGAVDATPEEVVRMAGFKSDGVQFKGSLCPEWVVFNCALLADGWCDGLRDNLPTFNDGQSIAS